MADIFDAATGAGDPIITGRTRNDGLIPFSAYQARGTSRGIVTDEGTVITPAQTLDTTALIQAGGTDQTAVPAGTSGAGLFDFLNKPVSIFGMFECPLWLLLLAGAVGFYWLSTTGKRKK